MMFGQAATSGLYYYPRDQEPYQGGNAQFYKDFHQILIDNNIKPCENKDEVYYLKVLINEDASIKYVKDNSNKELGEKNKCAYDLGLQVVKHMDKWNPAMVDGVKKQAVVGFYLKPNDLFENYKEGYMPEINPASFQDPKGGVNSFRAEVAKRIDLSGFEWKSGFKLVVVFVVERDGTLNDVKLEQSSGVKEFDERIIEGIKSIKKKWTPAKIGGVTVRYRYSLPLSFSPPN